MTVKLHGREYFNCDRCGHFVDADGKHLHEFLITLDCEAKNAYAYA